jgi:predicted transposase/invertase (TIGR01784 family)
MSDRVFKEIFHNQPGALIDLLNAFLPLKAPIESIEYMPMELTTEVPGLYIPIVDVRCRDRSGRHFIVEMQLQKQAVLFKRVMLNACRIYSRQLYAGDPLAGICPVHTLCLLDYELYPNATGWIHHAEPHTDTGGGMPMGELYFTFVEIRKWMKLGTFDRESKQDAWMMFFTKPEQVMEIFTPEQRKKFAEMLNAVDAWDRTRYTDQELWAMERTVQKMWAYEAEMHEVKKQGLAEGLAEGFTKGGENMLDALQYLTSNPSATNEELAGRFRLSPQALVRIRSITSGT